MGNKIVYGCQNFCAIPIVEIQNQRSLGTPIDLADMGLVNVDPSLTEEETKVYADNKLWARLKGNKEYTVPFSFRYLSARYVEYLGFKISAANGGISDTGTYKAHAICYESLEYDDETGEETRTLHYYYNAVASQPTKSYATKEEQVEAGEIGVEFSCTNSDFIKDEDDKPVGYFEITRTAENAAIYDNFKTAAILPTTELPVSA